MMENILFYVHGSLLLLYGTLLTGAFAGINFKISKNRRQFLVMFLVCGALQMITYALFQEDTVKKLYPLITHLPLLLFLCLKYHKKFATALTSIVTAYLFCQPANWFGILMFNITKSKALEYSVRSCVLIIVAFVALRYLTPYLARIYNKDTRSVYIFSIMPIAYYIFDYAIMVYTNIWLHNSRVVIEFLPFFFGIIYMIFAILYCSENEEKTHAQHKAEIVRITAEQQRKEIEAIKHNEKEMRILHHDMRLFLSSLSVCIEQNDTKKAKEMLASYTSHIENTRFQHFCNVDTINYVLSDFAGKCKANHITFIHKVALEDLQVDIDIFASILSNALDNALNAQKILPESSRRINLTLKTSCGKILLCVENPISQNPVFESGLPISTKEGHGYGTQSICYMTERLNGKYQFTVQDNVFVTKVII